MTDSESPGGCTVCEATLADVGRDDEWRIYGLIRDLKGSGDAAVPRGRWFVFCPDCAAGVEPTSDMAADMERISEVVRRSPHPATDAGYHSRGLLLARIIMASVPLRLDQLADFRTTFE